MRRPIVVIAVPFRAQKEQDRDAQRRRFEAHMASFLRGPLPAHVTRPEFALIVISQSEDRRKFNRGQLLNAAFREAQVQSSSITTLILLYNHTRLSFQPEHPDRCTHLNSRVCLILLCSSMCPNPTQPV